MKKILIALLTAMLAACSVTAAQPPAPPVIEALVTEEAAPIIEPAYTETPTPLKDGQVRLQHSQEGVWSIDVVVTIRELADFPHQDKPALNKFIYAAGEDQLAYMWIPAGESGSTFPSPEEDQCNHDPANFKKFYEVTLPENDDWEPDDVLTLSMTMDHWVGITNTGLCVMSAYLDKAPQL